MSLPSEEVDVFFRTTSLTPSRLDIVRQGRGREGGVNDRSCTPSLLLYYFTMTATATVTVTVTALCQAVVYVEPQDAGPTPAVRVWGGWR